MCLPKISDTQCIFCKRPLKKKFVERKSIAKRKKGLYCYRCFKTPSLVFVNELERILTEATSEEGL